MGLRSDTTRSVGAGSIPSARSRVVSAFVRGSVRPSCSTTATPPAAILAASASRNAARRISDGIRLS